MSSDANWENTSPGNISPTDTSSASTMRVHAVLDNDEPPAKRAKLGDEHSDLAMDNGKLRKDLIATLPKSALAALYTHLHSVDDINAITMTCRKARDTFVENESTIARAWIGKMIPESAVKLGVMAVASREFGKNSIQNFFRNYFLHKGEYPPSYFTMDIAVGIHGLVRAIDNIVKCRRAIRFPKGVYPGRFFEKPTLSEQARQLRSFFMIEIARNLFFDPHEDAANQDEEPDTITDWYKKYWSTFSKPEVQAAVVVSDNLENALFHDLKKSTSPICGCISRDEIAAGHFRQANRAALRQYSIEAGLIRLHKWLKGPPDENSVAYDLHEPIHKVRIEVQFRRVRSPDHIHLDMFLEGEHELEFASERYTPDAKALDPDECDKFAERGTDVIENNFDVGKLTDYYTDQVLWDQTSYDRWKQYLEDGHYDEEDEPDSEDEFQGMSDWDFSQGIATAQRFSRYLYSGGY
ncbi:hypothetical protein F5Y11DRAFT_365150 [Daldinia sp. FL1419]|nr:hypothetical protein F5Y11DRAFT_365150 [Daldinia sp. FL1419]